MWIYCSRDVCPSFFLFGTQAFIFCFLVSFSNGFLFSVISAFLFIDMCAPPSLMCVADSRDKKWKAYAEFSRNSIPNFFYVCVKATKFRCIFRSARILRVLVNWLCLFIFRFLFSSRVCFALLLFFRASCRFLVQSSLLQFNMAHSMEIEPNAVSFLVLRSLLFFLPSFCLLLWFAFGCCCCCCCLLCCILGCYSSSLILR